MGDGFKKLIKEIIKFRNARNWAQFHSFKNLSAAISIEAAELQEHFLWKSDSEINSYLNNVKNREKVTEELADILIYTLLFADKLKINLENSIKSKILINGKKYPVNKSKGNHKKYTELNS